MKNKYLIPLDSITGEPSEFTIQRENEDGSTSFIPKDEANRDYQRYLRWLENPDAEENGTIS